jgi:hypothetical protein
VLRCLLFCCWLFVSAPAAAQLPDEDLRQAEDALARALVAGDAVAFDTLLAPEFVLRGAPDVPRATWMANALSLCWGDRHEIDDFAVPSANGEVAVVSLVLTTFRDPQTCEPAIIRSLLTDLWRRTASQTPPLSGVASGCRPQRSSAISTARRRASSRWPWTRWGRGGVRQL